MTYKSKIKTIFVFTSWHLNACALIAFNGTCICIYDISVQKPMCLVILSYLGVRLGETPAFFPEKLCFWCASVTKPTRVVRSFLLTEESCILRSPSDSANATESKQTQWKPRWDGTTRGRIGTYKLQHQQMNPLFPKTHLYWALVLHCIFTRMTWAVTPASPFGDLMTAANRHVHKQSFSHGFTVFIAHPTPHPKAKDSEPWMSVSVTAYYVDTTSLWGKCPGSRVQSLMSLRIESTPPSWYFIILP